MLKVFLLESIWGRPFIHAMVCLRSCRFAAIKTLSSKTFCSKDRFIPSRKLNSFPDPGKVCEGEVFGEFKVLCWYPFFFVVFV